MSNQIKCNLFRHRISQNDSVVFTIKTINVKNVRTTWGEYILVDVWNYPNCVWLIVDPISIFVELGSIIGLLAGWKTRHLVLYKDSSLSWFTDSGKTKLKGKLEIEVRSINCHYT